MQLFIAKNKTFGDKKALEVIKELISKKPASLIGLAVGKTTDGLYKLLCLDVKKNPYFWSKIKIFQIDENLGISPDSLLSFNNEIRRELKPLLRLLNKKNVFLIDGAKNPKLTIREANKFIKKNKGFDLIVLGLGPEYDPHIAYNTSGKSNLNSKMRVVDLHPKTIEKLARGTPWRASTGAPTKGITLGIKDILGSKKTLLIAYGKDKTKSLQLTLKKVNIKRASASALLLHKNLDIIVDEDILCK